MNDYLIRHHADDTKRRRFANLPIWAQEALDALTRELDTLERRTTADDDASDTWGWPYASTPIPFGRPEQIRHRYPDGQEVTLSWQADQRPLVVPILEIMVTGGKPVATFQGASNVALLRLERDW
jgi:hypothetical protein